MVYVNYDVIDSGGNYFWWEYLSDSHFVPRLQTVL